MKQKIIAFSVAIVCIQFALQAQNLIDETKQWAVISIASMDTNLKSTHYYKFSGDSILNGSTYHILYKSTDSMQLNWTIDSYWWERNDSVFLRGFDCGLYLNDSTSLVYDFNLQVGDSFTYNIKVDSIRYFEWGGSIRKHWFFNQIDWNPYGCITWVEGVGNLRNFNYPSECLNSMKESLLCFHENGNLVYQNTNYNSCYVQTSSEMIINISKTNISISPSDNGRLIINNPTSEKGVIDFYTIDGRQIKELVIESEKTQVDLKDSRMIIYKFTNLNGKTQTGKFLNVLP